MKGFEVGTVSSAQAVFLPRICAFGNCAGNNFPTLRGAGMYRCEATSVEGFVQQLAVCYVANGYWFYVAGAIPAQKDPRGVDLKMIEKYEVGISKWTRARRKRLGQANVHYIRFRRFFVLLASAGEHPFFREETAIRDIRRSPIRFAGHSISYRKGRDGQWHASVRIEALEFRCLKRSFFARSVSDNAELIAKAIQMLPYEPYAPVRNQLRELLRGINRRRKVAGLTQVEAPLIRRKRKSIRPFESLQPETEDLRGET
jgi:hypothetical protein